MTDLRHLEKAHEAQELSNVILPKLNYPLGSVDRGNMSLNFQVEYYTKFTDLGAINSRIYDLYIREDFTFNIILTG